jgi:hypothetical protein
MLVIWSMLAVVVDLGETSDGESRGVVVVLEYHMGGRGDDGTWPQPLSPSQTSNPSPSAAYYIPVSVNGT